MSLSRLCLAAAVLVALCACDEPKPRKADTEAAAPAAKPAVPSDPGPTPAAPAWAAAAIGKPLREAYPKTGACKGYVDGVRRTYAGEPEGVEIQGWAFDTEAKAAAARVVLADAAGKVIAAGDGGLSRPDVPKNLPEVQDTMTGWKAAAPQAHGPVDAYAVTEDGAAACPIGRLDY